MLTIFKNTLARSATEIINRLSSLVFWIVISHYLGLRGIGIYAFANSIFQFMLTATTLGLGTWMTREIARTRETAAHYWGGLLGLGAIVSLLGLLIIWIVALLLSSDPCARQTTWLMGLALIPANGIYWARSTLFAFEKMEQVALARLIENFTRIGLGLWLLFLGQDVKSAAIALIVSKLIGFLVMAVQVTRIIGLPTWGLDRQLVKSLVAELPAFGTVAVINSVFWSVPVILLTSIRGPVATGLFSTALKFFDLFMTFAQSYGQAVFPVFARMARTEKNRLALLCQQSVRYALILALAVATGIFFYADTVIRLFGPDLNQAAGVLRILFWALVPFSAIPVLAFALISNNLQRLDLLANLVALIILTLGTVLACFLAGATGAAVTLVVAVTAFLVLEHHYVRQHLFPLLPGAEIRKILAVALMAGLCATAANQVHPIFVLPVMLSVYIVGLVRLQVLKLAELKSVIRVLVGIFNFGKKKSNDSNPTKALSVCPHPNA